jgi:hypothetical protein
MRHKYVGTDVSCNRVFTSTAKDPAPSLTHGKLDVVAPEYTWPGFCCCASTPTASKTARSDFMVHFMCLASPWDLGRLRRARASAACRVCIRTLAYTHTRARARRASSVHALRRNWKWRSATYLVRPTTLPMT